MFGQVTKKEQARILRRQGKSYAEIKKLVRVSKSTLSLWLRDIQLSEKQIKELKGRCKSRYIASKNRQTERIRSTEKIIKKSRAEASEKINDSLFLSGLMLYWAEGTKRNEMINFSNSDPNMIMLMMEWFRKICNVPEKKIRIQVHVHSLHCNTEIKKYWSGITKVPMNQFHKIIIKKTSLIHRKNILYNGTCCIRIYNRNLFRRIIGWKIGILEEFNLKDNYKIPK